jgi:hypothetical protein
MEITPPSNSNHSCYATLTPADVYFGRGQTILIERERINRQTIANCRLMHRHQAAKITNQTSQNLSYFKPLNVSKTPTTDIPQATQSLSDERTEY